MRQGFKNTIIEDTEFKITYILLFIQLTNSISKFIP